MDSFNSETFFSLEETRHKELWFNAHFVWDVLKKLPEYIASQELGKIETSIPQNVYLENPHLISIGKGCIIEPGAYIKGPCIVGKNVSIRHGAYLRENVIIGDHCVIGHCSEVKQSILLNNVHAAHFAFIGDSLVGNDVNLGAGVRLANFRIDRKKISVFHEGKKWDTGLSKLGAILGDNVQIGCNTVVNPAVFIGKNSICYPSINIGGYFAANMILKTSVKIIAQQKKSI